jgi:hypothetical protein
MRNRAAGRGVGGISE